SGAFVPNNTALNGTYIPSASDSLAGSVMLILTSTNTGSCAATSDTMMVFISYPAVVNAGPDQSVCSVGAVVSLNGNVSGGTTTGIWSAAGSGTFTPSNTTLGATYTPSAADIAAGSVTLYLTSTGNGICAAREDSMVVTIVPAAVVNAGNDIVVCGSNTDVPLNGTITGITTTGIWTTGGSGIFNPNATTLNANYALSNADVLGGSVTLVLTSTNNNICPSVSDTTVITIEPLPVAAFSSVSGDSLNVDFTDQSSGAVSWYWTFGDGGTSTQQNPQYNYPSSGSYQVVLVITSAGGCSDTATSNVNANEATVQPVAVPTGFSPNSDAHNDVLHVLGGPFSELDFKIYNEWGNLIFSTQDPNGGWDGTYKGKPQPGGIYVYTVTGKTIDGKDVNLSGNVTLIR
ncbi:MAG TPA: PKD domain-containing protein, partial [Bacteroidia bacterium]|nr:PKD domain-containing protein [Bacteroidia bacterium]